MRLLRLASELFYVATSVLGALPHLRIRYGAENSCTPARPL